MIGEGRRLKFAMTVLSRTAANPSLAMNPVDSNVSDLASEIAA
jgi:hypothetical protein